MNTKIFGFRIYNVSERGREKSKSLTEREKEEENARIYTRAERLWFYHDVKEKEFD